MSQGQPDRKGDKVLVALGSNAASKAGDPRATVTAALDALRKIFPDVAISAYYQTPAFPAGTGPNFVNAACAFHSELPAQDILTTLHAIEADFGRERTLRWGQRTLDLDLIAHGACVLPDEATFDHWRTLPIETQKTTAPDTLILPHPRLQDRAFVLIPLADVAADWVHPALGRSVAQMIDALPHAARAEIEAI